LANAADQIVKLSKDDVSGAKSKAIILQDKMCAYIAGLETAGAKGEDIQKHIDPVGDRLGAAFSLISK
jgi:hypothetical protein